jgi:quercetin dioxygenase-like cupin family protein
MMRRFRVVLSLLAIMLIGDPSAALAQEATPEADGFTEEGVTFEPLALGTELTLPATGELALVRISFEPGAGFPADEGDPSYALAFIESGELTVRQAGPFVVMRAGALATAMSEEMAGGTFAPATEEITDGQEVTLSAGDTALFPPDVGGSEIRNDGQERTVVLVAFVGPPAPGSTPEAGTPTP